MKRIFIPTLIALSFSTVAMAQQATDTVEPKVDQMTESAANTLENAADETEAAADKLAQDVDSMDSEMATERQTLRNPNNIEREGYMAAAAEDLNAEDLTGARVYGANDEDIGEIDELLLSEDGQTIDRVIVDVGGFLGMGEHEVAVTMEELHIMRSEEGMDFRVYMDATQEELEAQPEYEG